jgi:hypothetical protein
MSQATASVSWLRAVIRIALVGLSRGENCGKLIARLGASRRKAPAADCPAFARRARPPSLQHAARQTAEVRAVVPIPNASPPWPIRAGDAVGPMRTLSRYQKRRYITRTVLLLFALIEPS